MGFAGLYLVNARSLAGRPLAEVDLSFVFECDGGGACIGGGSPRLSIPIDSTGDGATDGYAFIDA